jgi:predicted  nucleic acid-binding Zn-ribbon protein
MESGSSEQIACEAVSIEFLMASLSSSRDCILNLEHANKDLMDALQRQQDEYCHLSDKGKRLWNQYKLVKEMLEGAHQTITELRAELDSLRSKDTELIETYRKDISLDREKIVVLEKNIDELRNSFQQSLTGIKKQECEKALALEKVICSMVVLCKHSNLFIFL